MGQGTGTVLWRVAGSSWVLNTRHRVVMGLFPGEFLHNGVLGWPHVDRLCGHRLPWGSSAGRYCGPASRLVRSQLCSQPLALAFVSAIVPLGRHATTGPPPPRTLLMRSLEGSAGPCSSSTPGSPTGSRKQEPGQPPLGGRWRRHAGRRGLRGVGAEGWGRPGRTAGPREAVCHSAVPSAALPGPFVVPPVQPFQESRTRMMVPSCPLAAVSL